MFWTVPISDSELTTNTPIGVRSIKRIFFEDRNGGVLDYSPYGLQTVSITIDGKQIMQDVPVLPFCTSSPADRNRFNWEDVALDVNINVNMSEIKISAGRRAADFNVIFVTSAKECDATFGFDYVEYRQFALRKADNSTYEAEAKNILETARDNAKKWETVAASNAQYVQWKVWAKELTDSFSEFITNRIKDIKELAVWDSTVEVPTADSYTLNAEPTNTTELEDNISKTQKFANTYKWVIEIDKNSNGQYGLEYYILGKEKNTYVPADGDGKFLFPTDYNKDTYQQTWQALVNDHTAAIDAYYKSLEPYGITGLSATHPTTDEDVAQNQAQATEAYNSACQYYETLTDEEKANLSEPPTLTVSLPPTLESLNCGTRWQELCDEWSQRAQNHIDYLYSEWGAAHGPFVKPTSFATLQKAIDVVQEAIDSADDEWDETYKTYPHFTKGVTYQGKSYTFPSDVTNWASQQSAEGLTLPTDAANLIWTVEFPEYADTTGEIQKPTKQYEYLKDKQCSFEYSDNGDYPDNTPHSYAYDWVNNCPSQHWGMTTESSAIDLLAEVGKKYLTASFGKEEIISLQKAPRRVVAMSVASQTTANSNYLLSCDVMLNFSMSSDIEQVFAPHTDLSMIQITDGVPYARAAHDFEDDTVSKNIRFTYYLNMPNGAKTINLNSLDYSKKYGTKFQDVKSWFVYLMFIYKKLA